MNACRPDPSISIFAGGFFGGLLGMVVAGFLTYFYFHFYGDQSGFLWSEQDLALVFGVVASPIGFVAGIPTGALFAAGYNWVFDREDRLPQSQVSLPNN